MPQDFPDLAEFVGGSCPFHLSIPYDLCLLETTHCQYCNSGAGRINLRTAEGKMKKKQDHKKTNIVCVSTYRQEPANLPRKPTYSRDFIQTGLIFTNSNYANSRLSAYPAPRYSFFLLIVSQHSAKYHQPLKTTKGKSSTRYLSQPRC